MTVFITGASSGIGKACAEQFAALGASLILSARRKERLEALKEDLTKRYGVSIILLPLDVRDLKAIEEGFKMLHEKKVEIDLLINNAGLALATDPLQEGKVENWETMIDTNIKGLLYMTRSVLPSMIKRNKGHIINIGSVAGRGCYLGGAVYSATKYAVKALSQSLRIDLLGTSLRVTEIAPGAVNTEFSTVRWNDKAKADKFYEGFCPLKAEDIADAVVYCATRPSHVNISELVLYPQAQASLTQVYRS